MANCTAPNQIAKGLCDETFSKLYQIGFIDTVANTTRPTVALINDRDTLEAMISDKELFLLKAVPTEVPEPEMNVAEIGTDQYFGGYQELRFKLKVSMNRSEYANFTNYNYFSNKEAYIITTDNKISYINDGGTVPLAYGYQLNMVQVGVAPIFSDGITPQSFYIYVNISPDNMTGVGSAEFDFPVTTLDPTYTAA